MSARIAATSRRALLKGIAAFAASPAEPQQKVGSSKGLLRSGRRLLRPQPGRVRGYYMNAVYATIRFRVAGAGKEKNTVPMAVRANLAIGGLAK